LGKSSERLAAAPGGSCVRFVICAEASVAKLIAQAAIIAPDSAHIAPAFSAQTKSLNPPLFRGCLSPLIAIKFSFLLGATDAQTVKPLDNADGLTSVATRVQYIGCTDLRIDATDLTFYSRCDLKSSRVATLTAVTADNADPNRAACSRAFDLTNDIAGLRTDVDIAADIRAAAHRANLDGTARAPTAHLAHNIPDFGFYFDIAANIDAALLLRARAERQQRHDQRQRRSLDYRFPHDCQFLCSLTGHPILVVRL
jgi:hypothetical protein